jgi:hypothetical protein
LRQQTRSELARLLTPAQLEEYLLRYSQHANDLRSELGRLRFFNATPDEFRAIFRAADTIEQQLALLSGSNDPSSVFQRRSLTQQRDNAIKLALGAERYEQFLHLHDPAYRDAFAAAQQAGTPEAANTLYQINLATAQQRALIRSNTNLSPQQLAIELKRIELEQLKASAQLRALPCGTTSPWRISAPRTRALTSAGSGPAMPFRCPIRQAGDDFGQTRR